MQLYPLTFTPKLCPKIWGGRRLAQWGKALPAGAAIGESWDIYDRPGDSALVASGPLAGTSLQQLMREWGPRLLGQKEFEKGHETFPIMTKFIDASEALSVQVHPDDDQALRLGGAAESGKTELWVVVEAAPGSKVVAGMKPGSGRKEFLEALKAGQLEGVLNEFEVKAGDTIFIPAGRVHAIGKGCLIAEIEQNSETTLRVYDYQRLENGKLRELHVEQALECIRFEGPIAAMPGLHGPGPVHSDYFHVERLDLQARTPLKNTQACFQILIFLAGEASLRTQAGLHAFQAGDTVLVPAELDAVLEPGPAGASLLWAKP